MGQQLHVGYTLGYTLCTRWRYTLVYAYTRWYTLVHVGVHVCARCQKTESFVTDGVLKRECGGGSCGVSYASTKVWIS